MTGDEVLAFLWYGYLTGMGNLQSIMPAPTTVSECIRSRSLSSLITQGANTWRLAIESCLGQTTKEIVVPLSGGLDSRAILAGLLEYVSPGEICTYTFGVPGTYDFDIGNLVAGVVGTRHCAFDLRSYQYTCDVLIDISRRVDGRTALFHHAPVSKLEEEYGNSSFVFWVGFMGGTLSGSHLAQDDSRTWDQAVSRFLARNQYCRSMALVPLGSQPSRCLPSSPLDTFHMLGYDEQLDFGIRQECYVKPLVLLSGYEYCTPFLHPEWVHFMLSLPRAYRQSQLLYKEILTSAFPRLFSLPVKNNHGLPLGAPRWRRQIRRVRLYTRAAVSRLFPTLAYQVNPGVNYIDFDRGLRERADLKAVVYENIQDLKRRGIVDWIDIDSIWARHQARRANHADALTLLASLEINLKAGHGIAQ